MDIKNLSLNFIQFTRNDKTYRIVDSNSQWVDTWKCSETREFIKCSRKDLLNWLAKGYIVPNYEAKLQSDT